MDTKQAAQRWAGVWEQAWPAKDVAAIAELYADEAEYRSHPLAEPHPLGARGYVGWAFADEEEVACRFGEPLVDGDRAAVEWWATLREAGEDVTLVGTTILRFGDDGLVVEHRDYWLAGEGRHEAYAGWRQ